MVVRFFTQTTNATNSRLFETCVCGEENSARHSLDKCERIMTKDVREEYTKKAFKLLNQAGIQLSIENNTLCDLFYLTFFTATISNEKGKGGKFNQMIELMKEVIMKTVINYKEEI